MDEWKTIESAPKDGKVVLLACEEWVWLGQWHEDKGETLIADHPKPYWQPFDHSGWQFVEGLEPGWFEPTHWMAMPAPPPAP